MDVGQLLRLKLERVAVEVDEIPGDELSAAVLVVAEPCGRDTGRLERLLDGQRLLEVPGGPVVDRPKDAGPDSGERVELLDGRVRAVGDHRPRVPERAVRVGALRLACPEAVCNVAVR